MRIALVLVTLAMFSAALVGCKAEGEIDDEVRTSIVSPR